jgi:hypothetical protein
MSEFNDEESNNLNKDIQVPEVEGFAQDVAKENDKGVSRRISVEIYGDSAISANVLETSLQISGSKYLKDNQLITLAILALSKVVKDCSEESGKRFPSQLDVLSYLDKRSAD